MDGQRQVVISEMLRFALPPPLLPRLALTLVSMLLRSLPLLRIRRVFDNIWSPFVDPQKRKLPRLKPLFTPSMAQCSSFVASLTREQRQVLASMEGLSRRDKALVGQDLISLCAKSVGEPAEAKSEASTGKKRKLRDIASELAALPADGTGPALDAIGERAVQHRYITQAALDGIRARIKGLPEIEQEDALVSAMRRFCACMQPITNVILQGHAFEGCPARLVGSAPPGGTPEVYNVAVLVADNLGPLHIRVQPKHFRPIPLESDARDYLHEIIPADHDADAWFEERVKGSEMMFRMEKHMGASFGPARPR